MRCKMEEAKQLLKYTDKPVSVISSYLCFQIRAISRVLLRNIMESRRYNTGRNRSFLKNQSDELFLKNNP